VHQVDRDLGGHTVRGVAAGHVEEAGTGVVSADDGELRRAERLATDGRGHRVAGAATAVGTSAAVTTAGGEGDCDSRCECEGALHFECLLRGEVSGRAVALPGVMPESFPSSGRSATGTGVDGAGPVVRQLSLAASG